MAQDVAEAGDNYASVNVPFSLGYTYDLSKRTMVYVYGGYAQNLTFLPDARATQLYVAFNHKF